MEHEVPPIVADIVEGNRMAPVQQMQLGFRIIRIFAIVRETMSSFISDGHFAGYPGRIIRAARGGADPDYLRRRRDECALDDRIRAA
eukprot:5782154-Pyramimonas_sp.AAC.1